jgi:hypothetical protein
MPANGMAGRVGLGQGNPSFIKQRAVTIASVTGKMLTGAGLVPRLSVRAKLPSSHNDVLSAIRGKRNALFGFGVFEGESHDSRVGVQVLPAVP